MRNEKRARQQRQPLNDVGNQREALAKVQAAVLKAAYEDMWRAEAELERIVDQEDMPNPKDRRSGAYLQRKRARVDAQVKAQHAHNRVPLSSRRVDPRTHSEQNAAVLARYSRVLFLQDPAAQLLQLSVARRLPTPTPNK